MTAASVVLLGGRHRSTNIVYNYLKSRLPIIRVVLEDGFSRFSILRRRADRLGLRAALGQACFRAFAVPGLQLASAARIRELKQTFQLDDTPIPAGHVVRIKSVNDFEAAEVLKRLSPSIVLVNGTRIISSRLLRSIDAPFVNLHAGLTPGYRGVHGAYWALVEREPHNCGVTIHLIDDGIDTGPVLRQTKIQITSRDNFVTYPFLQLAAALPLLESVVNDLLRGNRPAAIQPARESNLWSHPTLFEYLHYRIARGVK